jgi:hypothetical protein
LAVASTLAASNVDAGPGPCPAGLDEVRTAQLLFGRDVGDRLGVTDADWRDFVARDVTPRFPDGVTVIDAQGQWRNGAGRLVREPSKMLLIVLAGRPDEPDRLAAVAKAYEARFHQESVLLIEQSACATFRP